MRFVVLPLGSYFLSVINKKLIYIQNDENIDYSSYVFNWNGFKPLGVDIQHDVIELEKTLFQNTLGYAFHKYPMVKGTTFDLNPYRVMHINAITLEKGM